MLRAVSHDLADCIEISDVVAVDVDGAAVEGMDTQHAADQRCFASSVMPK